MANNIIVDGSASKKTHLWNGPKTMCNKKSLFKEEEKDFISTYTKYPETCCQKCVDYLKRRGKIK